jgi:hypothetical protein
MAMPAATISAVAAMAAAPIRVGRGCRKANHQRNRKQSAQSSSHHSTSILLQGRAALLDTYIGLRSWQFRGGVCVEL